MLSCHVLLVAGLLLVTPVVTGVVVWLCGGDDDADADAGALKILGVSA
jgi:hypothetical protein